MQEECDHNTKGRRLHSRWEDQPGELSGCRSACRGCCLLFQICEHCCRAWPEKQPALREPAGCWQRAGSSWSFFNRNSLLQVDDSQTFGFLKRGKSNKPNRPLPEAEVTSSSQLFICPRSTTDHHPSENLSIQSAFALQQGAANHLGRHYQVHYPNPQRPSNHRRPIPCLQLSTSAGRCQWQPTGSLNAPGAGSSPGAPLPPLHLGCSGVTFTIKFYKIKSP